VASNDASEKDNGGGDWETGKKKRNLQLVRRIKSKKGLGGRGVTLMVVGSATSRARSPYYGWGMGKGGNRRLNLFFRYYLAEGLEHKTMRIRKDRCTDWLQQAKTHRPRGGKQTSKREKTHKTAVLPTLPEGLRTPQLKKKSDRQHEPTKQQEKTLGRKTIKHEITWNQTATPKKEKKNGQKEWGGVGLPL